MVNVEPVVEAVLVAIERGDRDALRPLLHPYLHWTGADGGTVRGRNQVLDHVAHGPPAKPPLRYELRDGQIYRWAEPATNEQGGF